MPLVRSTSQSASTPQSINIFTGFQNWRRRCASNTVPSSPLTTSVTTNNTDISSTSTNLARSSSEHSIELSRLYLHSTASDEEPDCPFSTNSFTAPLFATDSLVTGTTGNPATTTVADTATTSANTEPNSTAHIRLLPNVELTSRCFVFDITDRILTPTTLLKIGRYGERHSTSDRLAFKSKVVSRAHAEIWMGAGNKIYIRDIGSSSGTFINRIRLSRSHETSESIELRDGDIIQLGVDYQEGMDQMYRAVKIRLEINRDNTKTSNFNRQAFQRLHQHLLGFSPATSSSAVSSNRINVGSEQLTLLDDGGRYNNTTGLSGQLTNDINHGCEFKGHTLLEQRVSSDSHNNNPSSIQECCICLYAIAPLQALFIAPCSHVYHFKCLRPILFQHYPGFSCPLCRNYYDLESSVAIEVSEAVEGMGISTLEAKPTSEAGQSSAESPTLSVSPFTSIYTSQQELCYRQY
ncbi:hypothetical protein BCR42DRAFT_413852 [Absidia repens]|uniref:SMAD/FHA domain-containing protein n=1 Tax=Absidia repens TaxID=90262 RepID=A0A1X2IIA6_9FUNG|nr:hypothetical protein BCR42DRAFT_413852 [Absidia repens]